MSTQPSSSSTASPDLWRWSASALAAAIRERQVSAAEAVEASLARIAEVNPTLNALVDVPAERARAAAAAMAERYGGARGGRLTFKGGEVAVRQSAGKKKKSKKAKSKPKGEAFASANPPGDVLDDRVRKNADRYCK